MAMNTSGHHRNMVNQAVPGSCGIGDADAETDSSGEHWLRMFPSCIPYQEGVPEGRLSGCRRAFGTSSPGIRWWNASASGFGFTEGPAWHPDGILLLSDLEHDRIYQWDGKKFRDFRNPSQGANGLLVLPMPRCLSVSRRAGASRGSFRTDTETLIDRFRGKRFLVPTSFRDVSRALYFTDPPWGLEGLQEDPSRELPFNGVYRFYRDRTELVDSTLQWPNGIALSPDSRTLYVADYEDGVGMAQANLPAVWWQYRLDPDEDWCCPGRCFTAPRISFRGPDGMAVDRKGNLYCTGPGGIPGVWIPKGLCGASRLPEIPST
ncbi:MAG: SMP-30/gluconolactonase/LRE family protein [Bacteroidales bacterium]